MTTLSEFWSGMDWWGLLDMALSAAAALFCITFHELSHGLAARQLGDPTARNAGRLTLNPIKHIDPVGLLMMLVAKVGWAKPVPVDMRYFKAPRRDMALTALAGPASNFLLAFLAIGLSALLVALPASFVDTLGVYLLLAFLAHVAVLSVGLGVFNLIPISPLDGSKVLYSFLPERIYYTILRYERFFMFFVILLTLSGVLSKPLNAAILWVLEGLCGLCRYSTWELSIFLNLFRWYPF